MILKKFLIPFLAVALIFSTVGPVQAQAAPNLSAVDSASIETIARNTPRFLLGQEETQWSDVSVVNKKPLYDFSGRLVAYSVDLKSNINDEKAFAIIAVSEEDGPIYEFAAGNYSPYDEVSGGQICLFDGIVRYYSHDSASGNYYDLRNSRVLGNEEVQFHKADSQNKQYRSAQPAKAKNTRSFLIGKTTSPASDPRAYTKIIPGLPDSPSGALDSEAVANLDLNATAAIISSSKIIYGVPDY